MKREEFSKVVILGTGAALVGVGGAKLLQWLTSDDSEQTTEQDEEYRPPEPTGRVVEVNIDGGSEVDVNERSNDPEPEPDEPDEPDPDDPDDDEETQSDE